MTSCIHKLNVYCYFIFFSFREMIKLFVFSTFSISISIRYENCFKIAILSKQFITLVLWLIKASSSKNGTSYNKHLQIFLALRSFSNRPKNSLDTLEDIKHVRMSRINLPMVAEHINCCKKAKCILHSIPRIRR